MFSVVNLSNKNIDKKPSMTHTSGEGRLLCQVSVVLAIATYLVRASKPSLSCCTITVEHVDMSLSDWRTLGWVGKGFDHQPYCPATADGRPRIAPDQSENQVQMGYIGPHPDIPLAQSFRACYSRFTLLGQHALQE